MTRTTSKAVMGLMLAGLAAFSSGAQAQAIDPANDFIPSYTGPHNGDLDVLLANVQYDGSQYLFSGTVNAPIGTTPTGLYVFGVDRGTGTARFGPIATGVLFDSVVSFTAAGVASVRELQPGGAATTLPGSALQISGNSFTAQIPASLLPSFGLTQDAYTWNLWPRSGAGGTNVISDFAPDNSNLRVQAVPEPGAMGLVLSLGAFGSASLLRGRRGRA